MRCFEFQLRFGAQAPKKLLHDQTQGTALGDEGGFAPRLSSNEEACELFVAAIEYAGYRPGIDISIALIPPPPCS